MNLELFRLVQKRQMDSFKNWNIDLAQSYFSYAECDPPLKTKETEKEGTLNFYIFLFFFDLFLLFSFLIFKF
jgi:hypothetical protein